MNHLKSAFGKEQKQQKSISRVGLGMKNYNKSKSESIWALDPDITSGGSSQPQPQNDKIDKILQSSLKSAFSKQKQFSEIIFYDIIENIQNLIGNELSELECLLMIQKKLRQIVDKSDQDQKNFNVSFYELLVKRIKKLKKKQKKDDLKQYDRIIGTNFKKKTTVQYINENQNKKDYLENKDNKLEKGNNNDGSSSIKSNSSNQGKLKNLLSSEMFTKDKDDTDKKDKQNQSTTQKNQSVSFSAVISQSMCVRQRAPRVPLKKQKPTSQQQITHEMDKDDEQESKDEAFIFFRPKRTKKSSQLQY